MLQGRSENLIETGAILGVGRVGRNQIVLSDCQAALLRKHVGRD